MILNSIKLNPFCALRNTSLTFLPGLNVILGPNEIGKSTVFHAIQSVLFTSTNLAKRTFEKRMKHFIPIDGDTAHVILKFDIDGSHYTLKRTWGATSHSELQLSSGSIVTDAEKINEHLRQLLPANEGTFRSVLMTYQAGLTGTLEELHTEQSTLHSLSSILRRAVLETDGVSVDLFRYTIEAEYNKYFSRWDQDLQRPEGGKGIHDKWKKEIGNILQAYYEKEEINSELTNAITFENELDTLNKDMAAINEQILEKETYIKDNKSLVESIQKMENLRLQIENLENRLDKYSEVNNTWPVYESEQSKMENELTIKRKKFADLEIEQKNAETMEENRTLSEHYKRAKKKNESLEKAINELSKMHELKKDTWQLIQKTNNNIETLKTKLAAGKISLEFKPKLKMNIKVQEDLNETVEKALDKEKSITIKAEGRIKLEHDEWFLKVSSGEGNFEEVENQLKKTKPKLADLLNKHNINTMDEAKKIHEAYEQQILKVETAREVLNDELVDLTFEELESRINELGEIVATRPLHEIVEEKTKLDQDIQQSTEKINEYKNKIEEYIEEYKNKKDLMLLVGKTMKDNDDLQETLDALPSLPADIMQPDEVVTKFETEKNMMEELKEQRNELNIQHAKRENEAPKITAQELKRQLKDSEEHFARILKQGQSIKKIRDRTNKILEKLDKNTYVNLQKDIENYIITMTAGRYQKIVMEESIPQGFYRKDGQLIPHNIFSLGTKDVLALAMRLSMGSFFLQDSKGVLVMDDPLVDMDPERQKAAAKVLKEFSKEKQLILFTCHPGHSDLLGGNKIELN